MNEIAINTYHSGDEIEISQLIRQVFEEFVAHDYSEAGNNFFYDWIEPEKIALRQVDGRTIWVARDEAKMVGVIEIRDNIHISLLFVLKEYQGKGIAGRLFREALKSSLQRNSEISKCSVHASPFSIPVYERLGFHATNSMKEENGIKYMPMEMNLGQRSIE
jgi:GNAT superfamily N-acetyltransferase